MLVYRNLDLRVYWLVCLSQNWGFGQMTVSSVLFLYLIYLLFLAR